MMTLKELLEKARESGQPVGYTGDREDWLVAYSVTRDSDLLTQANWQALMARLKGPEFEGDWAIERFDHWAVGWVDYLLVKPDSKAQKVIEEALKALENYPILDEELYSRLEWEETQEAWELLPLEEKIELCHKAGVSIFAARHKSPPYEVRDYLL